MTVERECTVNELKAIVKMQRALYLQPNDDVLFIVDDAKTIKAINKAFVGEYGYNIVIIPKTTVPGTDYDLPDGMLEGKTLAWLITFVSRSHAASTRKMMDQGLFIISNPGITPDWPAILDSGNREVCRRNASYIFKNMGGDIGGTIHILDSRDRTRLRLEVPNGNWGSEIGTREGIGTNGPYGEVFTAPYDAEGTYVLQPGDFLTNPINEVCETITLHIEGNEVVSIEGQKQARLLQEMLDGTNNPRSRSLGEFALGVNPGRPEQILRSVIAEKLDNGVHIAIGTNSICLKKDCPDINRFPHGRYNAGIHVDAIKSGVTVLFQAEGSETSMFLSDNGTLTEQRIPWHP